MFPFPIPTKLLVIGGLTLALGLGAIFAVKKFADLNFEKGYHESEAQRLEEAAETTRQTVAKLREDLDKAERVSERHEKDLAYARDLIKQYQQETKVLEEKDETYRNYRREPVHNVTRSRLLQAAYCSENRIRCMRGSEDCDPACLAQ